MIYTFLSGEGSDITIAFTDLRSGSLTFRESGEFRFSVDPRVKISIDPGVAYSFNSSVSHAVRAEHEVFVSDDEPRRDLMMFGCDLIEMSELSPGMSVPLIKCPGKIVYLMARSEVAAGHPALTARDQVREVTS
ncbi:MAG TPA: hypothetical protein VM621_18895 [Luteibacter sp.]|uniref:hypothetical protein n=1 Tax=Luteibacter sp. TaxID=1886636 RepID=UPI002C0696E6|nr:hypothetical protein [Luteibacter sp.]HVI57116.1 hypothetical protein [Luteibacter sp.]